jgi:hypothetical protein
MPNDDGRFNTLRLGAARRFEKHYGTILKQTGDCHTNARQDIANILSLID